jgi:hypothetical protein
MDSNIIDSLRYILTEKNINKFSTYNYDSYITQSMLDHLNVKYNYPRSEIIKILQSFYKIRISKVITTQYSNDIYNTNYDDNNLRIIQHLINSLKNYEIV